MDKYIVRFLLTIGYATMVYCLISFVSGITNNDVPNSTTYLILLLWGYDLSKGWLKNYTSQ